jgi:hypothetical protein
MTHVCTECFAPVEAHPADCSGCDGFHFPPLCCPGCDCQSFETIHGTVPPFPQEPAPGPEAVEVPIELGRCGKDELLAIIEVTRAERSAAWCERSRLAAAVNALADALELAEPALAIRASLRHGEQEQCQRALEAVREALRKAGRRLP